MWSFLASCPEPVNMMPERASFNPKTVCTLMHENIFGDAFCIL